MAQRALRPQIAVIGASEATDIELKHAHAVGVALAQADAILICGGLGGVMHAACEGAHDAGGLTVGILPGLDSSAANCHVEVAIPTGLGELRNGLIVRASDALIAIGGGWGTLSEIAFAMRTDRPVIGLGSWQRALQGSAIEQVPDPHAAVERALDLAGS